MTTEQQRWRWWMRSAAGATVVVVAGMVAAVWARSSTVVALSLGVLVLLFAGALAVHLRPGAFVPPPLQGLDVERRRLVAEAVNAGTPPADRELAGAVAAMARRRRTAMVLLLASVAISLSLRVESVVSGDAHPAFDLALLAFWVAIAAGAVRTLVRATRAAAG